MVRQNNEWINFMRVTGYSRQHAFTLIELIVTLSVAGILAAIAVPSFSSLIKDNRLTTQINELAFALNLARSEAIKRGTDVTLCNSNDKTTCSGTWSDGWIVFSDPTTTGIVNNNETIILAHSALKNNLSLDFNKGNYLTYHANGLSGINGTFKLCDDRGDNYLKALVVSSGRVRTGASSDNFSCS